jgi:hypothetical protein
MARLSISDAARVAGVSRVTLHRYIKAGRLSRMPDGSIDTVELVRAGFVLQAETLTSDTPATPVLLDDTAAPRTPTVTAETHARERLLELLQQQVEEYRALLRQQAEESRERERAYQAQITWLQQRVDHEHQRYDRLLEAPRGDPVLMPHSAPVPAPGLGAPAAPEGSRGDMRRRIMALLHDHSEGLSPAQVRRLLDVDKDLGSTMKAMARDGLLRRVQTGWYVAITA